MLAILSLVVLVGAIALLASSRSSVAERRIVIPREPNAAPLTYALLAGIPQHESVLGSPKAPVTLQFFGDLQCRESRQVMLGALPSLIRRWVRTDKLRIRFRSTETDTQGAGGWLEFRNQQVAALAAGLQGKLWNFIDVFYREQGPEYTGYARGAFLDQIAEEAGLDMGRWREDRVPAMWVPQLGSDEVLAKAKQLDSTPSFLVGPTGGKARALRHFGLEDSTAFDEAVERLL